MELAEDAAGFFVLGKHPVVVGLLLLQLGHAGQLLLEVLLAQPRFLLLGLDLGLRAPPLRADLQHVRGGSLLD